MRAVEQSTTPVSMIPVESRRRSELVTPQRIEFWETGVALDVHRAFPTSRQRQVQERYSPRHPEQYFAITLCYGILSTTGYHDTILAEPISHNYYCVNRAINGRTEDGAARNWLDWSAKRDACSHATVAGSKGFIERSWSHPDKRRTARSNAD